MGQTEIPEKVLLSFACTKWYEVMCEMESKSIFNCSCFAAEATSGFDSKSGGVRAKPSARLRLIQWASVQP